VSGLSSLIRAAWLAALVLSARPGLAADDLGAFPKPKFAFELQKSVLVPMRDGVRLSTDLYVPQGAGTKLPVILIRTQYDKSSHWEDGPNGEPQLFAAQGFVVAVQDIRGRYESEGEYALARHDAVDGYDSVDWLAKQPWSNGKVGTYGCSSLGITQVFQAQLRHPALAALLPQAAGGASRRQLWDVVTSGVPEIGWALEWFYESGGKLFARPPAGSSREQLLEFVQFFDTKPKLPKIDYAPILQSLPVRDMAERAGGPPSDWVEYVTREVGDPEWERIGYFGDRSTVDVPALFIDSWYDMSVGETLYLHDGFRRRALSKRARDNQFVIISPTDHCESEDTVVPAIVGERDLGDARNDFWQIYLRWFDHWLRESGGDFKGMPHVQYYLMGANRWRSAERWPAPGTRYTRYYLHSGGKANTRSGDGTLSMRAPAQQPSDTYTYDPMNPVPSHGINLPGGGVDQRATDKRQDRLVYTSAPLASGIEVTGPLQVTLYVSSDARDTDFTAQLSDVYPDGRSFNVMSGIARARYREGFEKHVWMEPGKVYPVTIDLQATSNYFAAGHRIQVQVSSSDFPRFARNMNTGGNGYDETKGVAAKNSVHHDERYPSHILLPVIAGGAARPNR
jgi:putative CocE/NonD family hydrolase